MAQILEWYRPDPLPKLIKLGVVTGSIMVCGVLVMALGYDPTPASFVHNSELWIVMGMVLVVIGVASTVIGTWKIHSKGETVLQVERKGLVFIHDETTTAIAWQAIRSIKAEKKSIKILYLDDKCLSLDMKFVGIDRVSLSKRLLEVKRKALLGIRTP